MPSDAASVASRTRTLELPHDRLPALARDLAGGVVADAAAVALAVEREDEDKVASLAGHMATIARERRRVGPPFALHSSSPEAHASASARASHRHNPGVVGSLRCHVARHDRECTGSSPADLAFKPHKHSVHQCQSSRTCRGLRPPIVYWASAERGAYPRPVEGRGQRWRNRRDTTHTSCHHCVEVRGAGMEFETVRSRPSRAYKCHGLSEREAEDRFGCRPLAALQDYGAVTQARFYVVARVT
jgi:hypothetical protein